METSRSKHWHLLGYVLTRQSDTRDVLHTRVMPSADCYTDHELVRCKDAFNFKSPYKRKGPRTKKLQVQKLRDPRVKKNNLQVMLEERLHCVTAAEPEEQRRQMKTTLQETTAEVVGLSTRKHQDWFDEADTAIQELLEKKRSCHNCPLAKPDDQATKAAYKTACSTLMLNFGPCRMSGGQDLPRGHNGMLTWVTCAPSTRHCKPSTDPHIQAPLHSSDGSTLLTDKEAILQRWSEHFEGLFSDRRTVQESSLAKIPQVDVKLELDDPSTREEIRKATLQLKMGKSPGINGIPVEDY